jgi:hypothetical protein
MSPITLTSSAPSRKKLKKILKEEEEVAQLSAIYIDDDLRVSDSPADEQETGLPSNVAPLPQAPPAPSVASLAADLNLRRSVATGIWPVSGDSDPQYGQLLTQVAACALAAQGAAATAEAVAACAEALRAARPAGLPAELHLAVVVLAWLRKHAGAERALVAGMVDKATEYLESVWPAAAPRSLGLSVLACMKLM